MEGISGGSLLLSGELYTSCFKSSFMTLVDIGFMVPAFGASLGVPGVVMGCGGLAP